jgi:hypothetical protein
MRKNIRKAPPSPPFDESIESFRNFLGTFGDAFTNAQLPELRRQMKAAATLLLELYLRDRRIKSDAGKGRKRDFDSDTTAP